MRSRPEISQTGLRPIVRETVTDQVYARLRDAIMRGELAPGQNVTIHGLAADLGCERDAGARGAA